MGLLEDIGQEQEKTQPNRCPMAKQLVRMPDDVRGDLDTAMEDPNIRHVAIARALTANGFPVSEKGVAAHRRGTCACARR